jgi:hypothetical protein
MPGIIGLATFRGSKHATLLLLDHLNLAVRGPAPKFSKRTILTGLELFFEGILIFSHLLKGYKKFKKSVLDGRCFGYNDLYRQMPTKIEEEINHG